MRKSKTGSVLAVRAIAGLHVVTLAWDFIDPRTSKRKGLLGFAIERTEFDGKVPTERYWLRGIKRFKFKDEGLAPGTSVPTSEHPIQAFQWGDYTAKPGTAYRYRIVPVYGKPKLLTLDDASATQIDVTTEVEDEPENQKGKARHSIYFNRGVAGSQAYARRYGRARPDETEPASDQMTWLSRGLHEALLAFIGRASGKDAQSYGLRAMLYEFRYPPIGEAFKAAARAGADVDVRYEAQSYVDENEEMIAAVRIKRICKPQKSRSGIRHNKFIVLIHKDEPIAVWTGSTNISAGGIFGHSNVGHIIWDTRIAQSYLDFWNELASPDVKPSLLKKANLALEPTPARKSAPPSNRTLTLFSPRDAKDDPDTLNWYADLVRSVQRIMCMTFAFNLDEIFEKVLAAPSQSLRYILLDKVLEDAVETEITRRGNTVVASGAKLEDDDLETFLGESLTGFNRNRYIHDKFILIDPLGDDPVVVTGTANFSRPSQVSNDENMLVIRGNKRVADIYFGEFMRIFDHLYSRYIVSKLRASGRSNPDAGYLRENPTIWQAPHFKPGPKEKRRRYFMGQ